MTQHVNDQIWNAVDKALSTAWKEYCLAAVRVARGDVAPHTVKTALAVIIELRQDYNVLQGTR